MSDDFRWDLPEGDEVVSKDPERAGRRRVPHRGILSLLVLVALLLVAFFAGNLLGRYQRATAAARADLQTAINLEARAWQSGNRNLFRQTLDPAAPQAWRQNIEREFASAPREPQQISVEDLALLGNADEARVTVRIVSHSSERREVRYYRIVNNQWRRTAPIP